MEREPKDWKQRQWCFYKTRSPYNYRREKKLNVPNIIRGSGEYKKHLAVTPE
jgi:hypothetical protein